MFGNLDPEAYDRQYTDTELVRRLAKYFRPHKRQLTIVVLGLLLVGTLDVVFPLTIARAVSALAEAPNPRLLWSLIGLVLVTGVASWTVHFTRRRLTSRMVGEVVFALRRDAFRATMAHDLSFFDEFRSGRIVSRITSDTQEFANVTVLVVDTISQLITVVLLAAVLISIEWRLALAMLLMTPVVLLLAGVFRKIARRVTRQGNRAMANVNAAIQETIAGIAVAKNFRQEAIIYDDFTGVNQQAYTINLRRGFVLSNVFPALNIVAGVGTAGLVYLGGLAAGGGLITAGSWYLFLQSMDCFFFPFIQLASFWSQVQAGLSATERVFGLMDATSVVKQTATNPVPRLRGEIEFEHLDFRYSQQETVLTDFTLHIQPCENIALVGHTGA